MAKKRWVVNFEYKGGLDQAFENDLRILAPERGGHFEMGSYDFGKQVRDFAYWFETEVKAKRFLDEVKAAHLGTKEFYGTVYSDTSTVAIYERDDDER